MNQSSEHNAELVDLDVKQPIWDQFFWVAPLVLVGSREPDGGHDLAPKHLAMPMGLGNYFGFMCAPRHGTYRNIQRQGEFTVSCPRPSQLVMTSLAASPRYDRDEKPSLAALPVFPATAVNGVLVEGCYLFLECKLHRIFDDFGAFSLITGEVVGARLDSRAERTPDGDDQQLLFDDPLLAYLSPGRFAEIRDSRSFPFPAGMKR